MKTLLLLMLMLLPAASFAKDPFQVVIPADEEVYIVEYNIASDTYRIELVSEPGPGPFYVTPEELAASVPTLSLQNLRSHPDTIEEETYKLKKEIAFHPPPFMEARKKKRTGK